MSWQSEGRSLRDVRRENEIIGSSRKDAQEKGLKKYIADKPCDRNHNPCIRYVLRNACRDCAYEHKNNWYQERKQDPAWVKDKNQKINEFHRKNPEQVEYRLAANRVWTTENRDKRNASAMKRHVAKMERIPPWVDMKKIEEIYSECTRMCNGIYRAYHVDHLVPLQGKQVSGLHVHTNLQILTETENAQKGNKFDQDNLSQGIDFSAEYYQHGWIPPQT